MHKIIHKLVLYLSIICNEFSNLIPLFLVLGTDIISNRKDSGVLIKAGAIVFVYEIGKQVTNIIKSLWIRNLHYFTLIALSFQLILNISLIFSRDIISLLIIRFIAGIFSFGTNFNENFAISEIFAQKLNKIGYIIPLFHKLASSLAFISCMLFSISFQAPIIILISFNSLLLLSRVIYQYKKKKHLNTARALNEMSNNIEIANKNDIENKQPSYKRNDLNIETNPVRIAKNEYCIERVDTSTGNNIKDEHKNYEFVSKEDIKIDFNNKIEKEENIMNLNENRLENLTTRVSDPKNDFISPKNSELELTEQKNTNSNVKNPFKFVKQNSIKSNNTAEVSANNIEIELNNKNSITPRNSIQKIITKTDSELKAFCLATLFLFLQLNDQILSNILLFILFLPRKFYGLNFTNIEICGVFAMTLLIHSLSSYLISRFLINSKQARLNSKIENLKRNAKLLTIFITISCFFLIIFNFIFNFDKLINVFFFGTNLYPILIIVSYSITIIFNNVCQFAQYNLISNNTDAKLVKYYAKYQTYFALPTKIVLIFLSVLLISNAFIQTGSFYNINYLLGSLLLTKFASVFLIRY